MNRLHNLNYWFNAIGNEQIPVQDIERLEKKIRSSIIEFRRKMDKTEYTTDKAFLDGSVLVLEWMQEELLKMKKGRRYEDILLHDDDLP